MSRSATSRIVRALALVVVVVGLTLLYTAARAKAHVWVRVARDANYDVEIDTARTRAARLASRGRWMNVVDAWYRTNHKHRRLYNGKEFDRELVHSVVRCDSLWFKVMSVEMSVGSRRPVVRQITPFDELYRQQWRHVELGTTEEIAAQAACHFGHAVADGDKRNRLP